MIASQKFRDKRTGELVTSVPIMDIAHFEEAKFGINTEPSIYEEVLSQPRPRIVGETTLTDEETYEHFMDILPPKQYLKGGFVMLEADSDQDGKTIYSAFVKGKRDGEMRYYHRWVAL